MGRVKILIPLQAVTLGALAGLLWSHGPLLEGGHPELLPAILLYAAIFLLPGFAPLVSLALFALFAAPTVDNSGLLQFVRLCLFAAVLIPCRHYSRGLSLIITSLLLWQCYFALYVIGNYWIQYRLPPLTSPTLLSFIIEMVAMLALPIVCSSAFVSFVMGRTHIGLPLPVFTLQTTFVAIILIAGGGFWLIRIWSGYGIEHILGDFVTAQPTVLIAVLGIIQLTAVVISVVANLVWELMETLARASDPYEARRAEFGDARLFQDYSEKLAFVQNNVDSMVEARKIVDALQTYSGCREESIQQRWEELHLMEHWAEVLERTVSHFPGACIAVLGTGKIVYATPSISELLSLESGEIVGESYAVLQSAKHPWCADVFGVISWACVESRNLLDTGARKMTSGSISGNYLDMVVSASMVHVAEPGTMTTGGDPRGNILIVVLLRPTHDLRPLQLRLLHPNEFELAGTSAVELSGDLQKGLQDILNQVQVVTAKLNNLSDENGQLFAESTAGTEISSMLADMDREVEDFLKSVQQLTDRWSHSREKAERCSLTSVTESSLNYLFELLGLERRITLSRGSSELKDSDLLVPDVTITAASTEVNCFLSYLLLLVKTILPRVRDVHVELDYEQISSGAAALFTGSAPGRYARLIVTHRGQSLTANTIAAQSDWLGVLSRYSAESTECALFLLTRQVRRMGGFISVQSSTSRGTTICMYLPEDVRRVTKSSGTNLATAVEMGIVKGGDNEFGQALIVSDDATGAKRLSEIVSRLHLEPHIRQAKDLLQEIVTPLSFNGLGFASMDGESAVPSEEAQNNADANVCNATSADRMDFQPFRLVIFDSKAIDFDILTLLDELGRENSRMLKVLLLEDEGMASSEILQKWKVVVKPVEDEYLQKLLEDQLQNESGGSSGKLPVVPAPSSTIT